MNIADRKADDAVGKLTLVNLLGMEYTVIVYGGLQSLAYFTSLFLVYLFSEKTLSWTIFVMFWLTAPLAIRNFQQVQMLWKDPAGCPNLPLLASSHAALALITMIIPYAMEKWNLPSTHLKIFGIYLYIVVLSLNLFRGRATKGAPANSSSTK